MSLVNPLVACPIWKNLETGSAQEREGARARRRQARQAVSFVKQTRRQARQCKQYQSRWELAGELRQCQWVGELPMVPKVSEHVSEPCLEQVNS